MKIFITGASSGLGMHLVREFAGRGDTVWGIGRRSPGAVDTGSLPGGRFSYRTCDTTDRSAVRGIADEMMRAQFIPDIIILCAGGATEDILEGSFDLSRFEQNLDLNLLGALHWVEIFLPHFLERDRGTFAAVSSMGVLRETHRRRIGYSASKGALNKAFENLRMEYLPTGLRFVTFSMGRMTERGDTIGVSYREAARLIGRALASGRGSRTVSIPFKQFVLTRIASWVPERLFRGYIAGRET